MNSNNENEPIKTTLNKGGVMRSLNLKKLKSSRIKYENELLNIEAKLETLIDFDFFLSYQESDSCHVVVSKDDYKNAPLNQCISVIKNKGRLTRDDYEEHTI